MLWELHLCHVLLGAYHTSGTQRTHQTQCKHHERGYALSCAKRAPCAPALPLFCRATKLTRLFAATSERLGLPHPLLRIPAHAIRGVCCPSCNSEHVHFHAVSAGAAPRSYVESPNTRDMLANVDQRARKAAGTTGAPLQLSATIEGGDDPVSPAAAGAGAGAPATGVVLASAVSRQTSFVTVLQQRLDFESVADGDEEEEVEEAQPRSLPLPLPPSPQRAVVAPLPAPLPMLPVAAATVPAAAAAEDGIGPGVSENPQLPDPRMRLPASEAAAAWQPHCSSAGRRDPAAAAAPSSRGALQDVSNRQQLRVSVPGTKSAVAAAAVPASASAAAVALSIVPSTAAAAPSAFSAPAATPITLPLAPFCATSLPLPLAPLSPAAPRAVAATAECDAAAADDLELPLLPADFEDDLLLDDLPLMGC